MSLTPLEGLTRVSAIRVVVRIAVRSYRLLARMAHVRYTVFYPGAGRISHVRKGIALRILTEVSADEVLQAGWGLRSDASREVEVRWFTGKIVAYFEAEGRSWCLAGSPANAEQRVRTGAVYQERLVEAGFAAIPGIRRTLTGDLIWSSGDRAWVLTGWVKGGPVLDQGRWTPEMLEQLGRAVGELHRVGRDLIPPGARPTLAPAQFWAGDWSRFEAWAHGRWKDLMAVGEVVVAPDLGPLREVIAAGVAALPGLPAPFVHKPTVVHGDLWTEHVLFRSGDRLSGFIDLDGLDVGDGVGELAALLSDFAQLDPERSARVVGEYGSHCRVTVDDLEAAFATVIRHHVLVLLARIGRWSEETERRPEIIEPTTYWVDSLRHAIATDRRQWVSAVLA